MRVLTTLFFILTVGAMLLWPSPSHAVEPLRVKIVSVTRDNNGTPGNPSDDRIQINWEIRDKTNTVVKTGAFTYLFRNLAGLSRDDVRALLGNFVDQYRMEKRQTKPRGLLPGDLDNLETTR